MMKRGGTSLPFPQNINPLLTENHTENSPNKQAGHHNLT